MLSGSPPMWRASADCVAGLGPAFSWAPTPAAIRAAASSPSRRTRRAVRCAFMPSLPSESRVYSNLGAPRPARVPAADPAGARRLADRRQSAVEADVLGGAPPGARPAGAAAGHPADAVVGHQPGLFEQLLDGVAEPLGERRLEPQAPPGL